jgi:hypothetical protein
MKLFNGSSTILPNFLGLLPASVVSTDNVEHAAVEANIGEDAEANIGEDVEANIGEDVEANIGEAKSLRPTSPL